MKISNATACGIMVFSLMAALSMSGCVSTKATYLDPTMERYAPVPVDSVRVFMSQEELDTLEYVRIAYIEASGSGEYTSQTGMIDAIRKKAAKLGCNAVLLPRIDEPGAEARVAGAIFGTGTERKGNAVGIRIIGRKPADAEP